MKKYNKIEQQKELLEEALIINESVCWWEKEMDKVFSKIEKAEYENNEKEMAILLNQLENLIGKGEIEVKHINTWMIKKDKINGKKKS